MKPPSLPQPRDAGASGPVGRILVIEDQPEIADVLGAYLERAGFAVICAFDGEQGAYAIQKFDPDIVFLDLLLPQRDGRDLLEAMNRLDRPALVVASAQVEASCDLARDVRVDAVLEKPYDPNAAVSLALEIMKTRFGKTAGG